MRSSINSTLFRDVQIWDASREELEDGMYVLVENDRLKEISDRPLTVSGAYEVHGTNKTLILGLIDCHCHATMTSVNL